MTFVAAIFGLVTLLMGVAVWSRLVSDQRVPGLITGGTNALANIFKGVFRG